MKLYLKRHKEFLIIFFVSLIFLSFVGEMSYILERDSTDYIDMYSYVPPLYPLFLAMLRSIFGLEYYLIAVVILQGIISAACIGVFIVYCRTVFKFNYTMTIVAYAASLIPFVREGMRTEPRYLSSHVILTESLCIPLFYLFLLFSLKTLYEKSFKALCLTVVMSAMLTLIRAQFLACFCMTAILVIYLTVFTKGGRQKSKRLVLGILILFIGYTSVTVVEDVYKYTLSGTTQSPWNSTYYLVHMLYCSDAEDAALFESVSDRKLYDTLYQQFDEKEFSYRYAGDSFYEKGKHWAQNFSEMCRIARKTITEAVTAESLTEAEVNDICAETVSRFMGKLLIHLPRYIEGALRQCIMGITSSVFLLKDRIYPISFGYALMSILAAVGLSLYRIRVDKESKAALFMLFIVIFIVGNSLAVSLTLHPMARYVTYSTGLFYIAGLALLGEFFNKRRGISKDD